MINHTFFAVDVGPFEVEVEGNLGTIGKFHLVFVVFRFDSKDFGLWEIVAYKSGNFRIIGVVSASGAIPISTIVDDIEIGVKLEVNVVVEFDFPAIAFPFDFIDVLIGIVGGDVGRNLFRDKGRWNGIVDRGMFTIHLHPFKCLGEIHFSVVT